MAKAHLPRRSADRISTNQSSLASPPALFRPTLLAVSVSLALYGPRVALAHWGPNAEVYIEKGDRSRIGADVVLPFFQDPKELVFFDGKAHGGDGGSHEFNLGLAWRRYINPEGSWALGLYGAYDRRRLRDGKEFDQATFGIEGRSADWDVRANYYHPITDRRLVGLGGTNHFAGFRVYRNGVYEEAMGGFDLEVGRRIPYFNKAETRVYLAGYRFEGDKVAPVANGARLRFEVRPRHDIIINASVQKDNYFGTAGFLQFRYAFGQSSETGPRTLSQRMTDPWQRDIHVVVSKPTESNDSSLSQVTNDLVVNVDSSKPAGGDGSYEHPYQDTASCPKCADASYDLVRLWKGDSSLSNPYTSTTLQAGQTLWGQGVDIFNGQLSGNFPVIGNGGTAITLADDSSVRGVFVNADDGIVGDGIGGNIDLSDNVIQGEGGTGIRINTDQAANINIARNTISGVDTGLEVGAFGTGTGDGQVQNVTISGNRISANAGVILYHGAKYGTSTQNATLSGNVITSKFFGVGAINYAYQGSAVQNVTVANNTITLNFDGGPPISGAIFASNNGVPAGSGGPGPFVPIVPGPGSYGTATQHLSIADNTIRVSGGGASGITLLNGSNKYYGGGGGNYFGGISTQTATISGNTITGSGNSASGILALNGTPLTGRGLPLLGPSSGGYYSGGSESQSLSITGNTISASGDHSYGVSLLNGPAAYSGHTGTYNYGTSITQTASFTNNTISTSGAYATGIGLYNGADVLVGGGHVTQSVTLSGDTVTAAGTNATALGVSNYAYVAAEGSSVTQNVNIAGATLSATGDGATGVYQSAYAYDYIGSDSSVSQNVTIASSSLTVNGSGSYGTHLYAYNKYAGGDGILTQHLSLSNTTVSVTGTDATGLYLYANEFNVEQRATLLSSTLSAPTPVINDGGTCTGAGVAGCP